MPWQYLPPRWQIELALWRRERPARRRHHAAKARIAALARSLSAKCLEDIRTKEDWERARPELRRRLAWMLGLEPPPERTPLQVRITGRFEHAGCRIEKVVMESSPGLLVTGNLYLPADTSTPRPCVLYLCGHMNHPLGAKVLYQDRCWWYAQHGFACLALDPLELGEVPGVHRGTYCLNYWHWLSLAYTPAGVEVWNAMRALDWIKERPEIDARRIGVTGISGGGVMTWFLAALDERVTAAVPTCGTYTIGEQVSRGLLRWQCDCVYYPNIFELDFPIVAALVAPRPALILHGAKDLIFPPAGCRQVFARARRIYAIEGQPDRLGIVDSGVGHEDNAVTLRESRAWMQRWLGAGAPGATSSESLTTIPAGQLACLDSPPPAAANYSIDRHFVRAAEPVGERAAGQPVTRRFGCMASLRRTVFQAFGGLQSGVTASKCQPSKDVVLAPYGVAEEWMLETEPDVEVRALVLRPATAHTDASLVVSVRGAAGTRNGNEYSDLIPLMGRAFLVVVYPRFAECTPRQAESACLERSAALVGRSIQTMQIWDVVQTVRWAVGLRARDNPVVSVAGRGVAAVTALYAGLIEERIDHVIVDALPASHWRGPALPGILRFADLPEVAGWLAPRRLTFLPCLPPEFEVTARFYREAAVPDAVRAAESLAEALLSQVQEPK